MRIDPVATITDGLGRSLSASLVPVAGLLFGSYLVASYGTLATILFGLPTTLVSRRWWVAGGVLAILAALWIGTAVVTLYAHVVAARTMGPAVPGDRSPFTRRIGRAMASTVALAVVLAPLALGGTLLAVVPGIAVVTLGAIALVTIAIEDRSAAGALDRAWALAATDRATVAVVATLLAVGVLVGLVGSLLAIAVPFVGGLLRAALLTAVQLALIGVFVEAVVRLREIRDVAVRPE
ncbi:hypothetical protein [Halococcoides cellulosivorans]|uniref:Glycerophosphoryl diester phosphodiesterase membrane domain-containing protein n=1 Tax=Halococcoides cellulosivorans TaxID=1679096 RepID=A0A2R4WY78_9EURY|nr:hypothetical protein [Halococcoides cellulosivorans]AWB26494.1 hypothetical protein HARCEL1_01560 [Halococcoides cellulosivorans]